MDPAVERVAEDEARAEAIELASRLAANVERVVHGKPEEIRLVLAALISGGHVLVEDLPGTAKTVLARSLAARSTEPRSRASSARRTCSRRT